MVFKLEIKHRTFLAQKQGKYHKEGEKINIFDYFKKLKEIQMTNRKDLSFMRNERIIHYNDK